MHVGVAHRPGSTFARGEANPPEGRALGVLMATVGLARADDDDHWHKGWHAGRVTRPTVCVPNKLLRSGHERNGSGPSITMPTPQLQRPYLQLPPNALTWLGLSPISFPSSSTLHERYLHDLGDRL
jgi:hypothetical protein